MISARAMMDTSAENYKQMLQKGFEIPSSQNTPLPARFIYPQGQAGTTYGPANAARAALTSLRLPRSTTFLWLRTRARSCPSAR